MTKNAHKEFKNFFKFISNYLLVILYY